MHPGGWPLSTSLSPVRSLVATGTGWDQGILGGECGGLWVYSVERWAFPSPGSREKGPCPSSQGSGGRIFPLGSGCTGVNEGGGVSAWEVSKEPSLHGKSPNSTSLRGAFRAGSQPEGAFPIFEGWEVVIPRGTAGLSTGSERSCPRDQ